VRGPQRGGVGVIGGQGAEPAGERSGFLERGGAVPVCGVHAILLAGIAVASVADGRDASRGSAADASGSAAGDALWSAAADASGSTAAGRNGSSGAGVMRRPPRAWLIPASSPARITAAIRPGVSLVCAAVEGRAS
jgi:hypothetical protein